MLRPVRVVGLATRPSAPERMARLSDIFNIVCGLFALPLTLTLTLKTKGHHLKIACRAQKSVRTENCLRPPGGRTFQKSRPKSGMSVERKSKAMLPAEGKRMSVEGKSKAMLPAEGKMSQIRPSSSAVSNTRSGRGFRGSQQKTSARLPHNQTTASNTTGPPRASLISTVKQRITRGGRKGEAGKKNKATANSTAPSRAVPVSLPLAAIKGSVCVSGTWLSHTRTLRYLNIYRTMTRENPALLARTSNANKIIEACVQLGGQNEGNGAKIISFYQGRKRSEKADVGLAFLLLLK